MKKIKFIKLVFILVLSFLISCSKTPQEQILGKWRVMSVDGNTLDNSRNLTLVFSENGILSSVPNGVMSGKWSIPKEGILLITKGNGSKSEETTYALSESGALILSSDKIKMELTRVESSSKVSSTGGIVGLYGGERCAYEKLEFREGGKVYITFAGMELPGTYEMDGDRVSVSTGDQGVVFRRNGNVLDGGSILGICTRL